MHCIVASIFCSRATHYLSINLFLVVIQTRACVVANDKLLAIGGQEGDFMAKSGSSIFKCFCSKLSDSFHDLYRSLQYLYGSSAHG